MEVSSAQSMDLSNNNDDPMIGQENGVNCPVCMTSLDGDDCRLCCDRSHPGCHEECFIGLIVNRIDSGFPGYCPTIKCPNHSSKIVPILDYKLWTKTVSQTVAVKHEELAKSTLAFLCGGCHTLKPVAVVITPELTETANSIIYSSLCEVSRQHHKEFLEDIVNYSSGLCGVEEMFLKLSQLYFPQIQTESDDRALGDFFKHVLQLIIDPERRANLHSRYLRARPRFWTPCCNREHCYRCKTKDFHTGKSCEENTGALDSSIVHCPRCSMSLVKGDGCNTVTCVCGNKFSWSEEKENGDRRFAFLEAFPTNTSSSCADVLCALVPGNSAHALAWSNRNTVEVNQALLQRWVAAHPHCPSQCTLLPELAQGPVGWRTAVQLWKGKYPRETAKCLQQMELSKRSLFDAFAGDIDSRFQFARRLLRRADCQGADSKLVSSVRSWVSANQAFYNQQLHRWSFNSAMQFLFLHGDKHISQVRTSKSMCPSGGVWNSAISNPALTFSNDNSTVRRPGGVSSYPAALANLTGTRCSFRVLVQNVCQAGAWLTFGLTRVGFPLSGSDGVGRTQNSWGVCDERDSTNLAFVSSCGTHGENWRKFVIGDELSCLVDTAEGWCEIALNDVEFAYRFVIPPMDATEYAFAMTFANDHQVTIMPSEVQQDSINHAELATLNTDHTEMYFNLRKVLKTMIEDPLSFSEFAPLLRSYSNQWEDLHRQLTASSSSTNPSDVSLMTMVGYDTMRPLLHSVAIENKGCSAIMDVANADHHFTHSWNNLFRAACWGRANQEAILATMKMDQAIAFRMQHEDSSPFMAAAILHQRGNSAEDEQAARAYMQVFDEEMNDWYQYNNMMDDPLFGLKNCPACCMCLPRHTSSTAANCPMHHR